MTTYYTVKLRNTTNLHPVYLKSRKDRYGHSTTEISEARYFKTQSGAEKTARSFANVLAPSPEVHQVIQVTGEFGGSWIETERV